MKNFNMGALRSWRQVGVGELLDFPVPPTGFRAVAFDLIADAPVSVRAVSGDDAWLIAYGEGLMTCKFAVDDSIGIVIIGPGDTDVFIRTHVDTQVIPESEDASYTTIEPRTAGPSDDIKRMMQWVKLNAQRRENQLLDEIRSIRDRRDVVDGAPAPAPAPAPAKEGGSNDEA